MVNYKRMREEIGKLKNKNDVIALAKVHYRKLTRADRAKIFNEVIQDRQTNLEKFKFSLRLSIELSCIFISYKTNLVRVFSKHKFSLAEEKEMFIVIVEKINENEESTLKKILENCKFEESNSRLLNGETNEVLEVSKQNGSDLRVFDRIIELIKTVKGDK